MFINRVRRKARKKRRRGDEAARITGRVLPRMMTKDRIGEGVAMTFDPKLLLNETQMVHAIAQYSVAQSELVDGIT